MYISAGNDTINIFGMPEYSWGVGSLNILLCFIPNEKPVISFLIVEKSMHVIINQVRDFLHFENLTGSEERENGDRAL